MMPFNVEPNVHRCYKVPFLICNNWIRFSHEIMCTKFIVNLFEAVLFDIRLF